MSFVEAVNTNRDLSTGDRMAAAFLWILMAVGSFAMWVGVPAGFLWVAGKITSDQAQHITLSVIGVPLAIILWARGLFWLNRLYMRVTMPRLMRGPAHEAEHACWALSRTGGRPRMIASGTRSPTGDVLRLVRSDLPGNPQEPGGHAHPHGKLPAAMGIQRNAAAMCVAR